MRRVLKKFVPRWAIKLYHLVLAVLANLRYGFPSRGITILGITGTDGKTTTSYFTYSILKHAGKKAALVTSAGAQTTEAVGDVEAIGLHVTTPGPFLTQKLLSKAKQAGLEYVVLETTSHGLDQHRVWGVEYTAGAVTNITREHLDYHGTWEEYLNAKAKLLKNVKYSILNKDDESYQPLLKKASGKVITYSKEEDADFTAANIKMDAHHLAFDVPALNTHIDIPTLGDYNISNALAAIALTSSIGISAEDIVSGMKNALLPPGRLERIEMGQDFTVFVDFAHTSHSMETMLKLLRQVAAKRLIVVFGCAGLRDFYKRFPMGASAGRYADFTVITAEDPRTEDLDAIMEEIARGAESEGGVEGETYIKIGDREEAIHHAIEVVAQPGDIVVAAGKAQEGSMCYGEIEYPWDEFAVVHSALENRVANDKQKVNA